MLFQDFKKTNGIAVLRIEIPVLKFCYYQCKEKIKIETPYVEL
jgi:hypothetical protein